MWIGADQRRKESYRDFFAFVMDVRAFIEHGRVSPTSYV
jgi:hypothetical protein